LPLRAKPVLYATGRDYTPHTYLVKGFGTPIPRLIHPKSRNFPHSPGVFIP
jgi:hypothetical protein